MFEDSPKSIRKVDNQEYLGVLKELILDGKEVNLLVVGSSMAPFIIHERDHVILGPVQEPLKKGRIVFYQRANQAYVLHRICKVCPDGTFDIVGDNQTQIEHGVKREQIFAQVNMVIRKGKKIVPGDFWWRFFEKTWLRVLPWRPLLVKLGTVLLS